jgi:predicted flap endonuclease-1-like 5' DNA nuclease/outer membrane murein-binding lipoprotein Lpp
MFPEGFFSAAGEAIILMLVAAILAGLIVYLLMRSRYQRLQDKYDSLAGKYSDLDNQHQALSGQFAALQPKYQALEEEHGRKSRQLDACAKERKALEERVNQLSPLEARFQKLETEHAANVNLLGEWEQKYHNLSVKATGLQDALKEERKAGMDLQNKLSLALVAKPEEKSAPTPEPQARGMEEPKKLSKAEKEEETLARIKDRAQEINFGRIGVATAADKDDLKIVKGIGPFLEKKLNSIGIYTFRQIANFTTEDEEKVNEIIEFFPGRIRRDNWSAQAEGLADEKDNKQG